MKIALFASAFHPGLGGVEEAVRQLAHALQRAGHEALIVTQRWPRDLAPFEEFEGLRVYRFSFRMPIESPNLLARSRNNLRWRLTKGKIQSAINEVLRRENIEIVNIHCVSGNAVYGRQAALDLNLPLVVTAHGEFSMDAQQLFQRSENARQMLRQMLRDAEAITGCSQQSVNEIEEFFGQPFGQRARTIYSGIRLADFAAPQAPRSHQNPYLLSIGRHVEQKGFDILIRAYAHFKKRAGGAPIPDLLIAGDGEERAKLENLSRELNLQSHITFVGRTARAQTVELFQNCEFFVLPSRKEPMGIVNLEAMAAGKAVVASNVGGVPELVADGASGILVAPEDENALAHALGTVWNDAELREKMGICGSERVKKFDWDALAAQYLKSYEEAHTRKQKLFK